MTNDTMSTRSAIHSLRIAVHDAEIPIVAVRRSDSSPDRGTAVVIVPSGFGIAHDLEEQMLELAAHADVVVAIEPFVGDGHGVIPYDDTPRVLARLARVDRDRLVSELASVIDWARSEGTMPRRIVVLGICFGGPLAMRAAADGGADAVVVWHGTGLERCVAIADSIRCPIAIHVGGADPFVPAGATDSIRAAFAHRADVAIAVHPGATHGFSHRSVASAYHPAAEREGMESVRTLLGSLESR